MPLGAIHDGKTGAKGAKLIVSYVVEMGKAPRNAGQVIESKRFTIGSTERF